MEYHEERIVLTPVEHLNLHAQRIRLTCLKRLLQQELSSRDSHERTLEFAPHQGDLAGLTARVNSLIWNGMSPTSKPRQ